MYCLAAVLMYDNSWRIFIKFRCQQEATMKKRIFSQPALVLILTLASDLSTFIKFYI